MGHIVASAIKDSLDTLKDLAKEPERNTVFVQILTGQSTQRPRNIENYPFSF